MNVKILKKGVWIYFLLLIFEGALRKWFLPFLSTPLLLVRDPLALYLLFTAYRYNILPKSKLLPLMVSMGVISIFTAVVFGHGNLYVALFGARILFIQFPMLLLIGQVFSKPDVIQLGKIILWIAIPMAILFTLQFYSPQSAWVNRGVGGSLEGAGFSGANGYFRPPGTFSFTQGAVYFFSIVAAYVFYFWLHPKTINKTLLIGSTIALIVAIPTSISRTLFFQVIISLLFFMVAKSSQPGFFKNMIQMLISFVILWIVFINIDAIDTQIDSFTKRFTIANEAEGGTEGVLIDRFLGGMLRSFKDIKDEHAIFGQGIGMGTNVGAKLLGGNNVFLISEGEWGRVIGESGILFGFIIISIRVGMLFTFSLQSVNRLRNGYALPWMLLSFGFVILLLGQWSQPTNLGFYVLIGGLLLASLKEE